MKTFKIIVYSALLIFHLTAIIIISVGKNDLNFLLNLFKNMDLMMYSAYLGLILFLILLIFEWQQQKHLKKVYDNHSKEINQLKAKLYDKKETETPSVTPKNTAAAENLPASETSKSEDNKNNKS
ncbi:hypothetical protein JKA74_11685 [Marivirga sp. S37H4]|uniref:Lipopolysaccharide assembly protein A domain-containing protein n=1 Tax=Marivirga aurantiaca TaxID=2802615 RepID=A0A934WZ63_9BACT|nr:hypothetical protein [Marivirga aurantiaca]MBK6265699.1 hypothetical protein [Marivirga aurantiaca]